MPSLNRAQRMPCLLGAIVCTLVIVVTIYSCANTEFTHSVWVAQGRVPPAITELFRKVYKFVWLTGTLTMVWSALLLMRKEESIAGVGWFLAAAAIQCSFWVCFTLLAIYLANQTFMVGSN